MKYFFFLDQNTFFIEKKIAETVHFCRHKNSLYRTKHPIFYAFTDSVNKNKKSDVFYFLNINLQK